MWHPLSAVAKSRNVDPKEFADFALAHSDAYGIVTEFPDAEVNTWHVDKLVADFKAQVQSKPSGPKP